MFSHTDRIQETKIAAKDHYVSHQDGSNFEDNELLSSSDCLKLPLILYIYDLEIANPLGIWRKIHKLCSVYWVVADLPSKYRSALHVIQLGAICKMSDIKEFGYERALDPLLRDIHALEQDVVFIDSIGKVFRGTVMCLVSDNLAAHALEGFTQCYREKYFVDSAQLLKTKLSLMMLLVEHLI